MKQKGSGKVSLCALFYQASRHFRGKIPVTWKGRLTPEETELYQRFFIGGMYKPEFVKRTRPFYPQHYIPPVDEKDMLDKPPTDGPVWNLGGASTTLSETLESVGALQADKAVLMLGSYTCPVFRRRSKQVLALARAHKLPLVFVYVYEAHVNDGWQLDQNDVIANYPKNKAERLALANKCAAEHLELDLDDAGIKMVVDHVDTNALNKAYEAVPVRIYTLRKGKVTYRTGPGPYMTNMKTFVESLGLDHEECAKLPGVGTPL
jgi:type I thyroxine 5'-deiodinase